MPQVRRRPRQETIEKKKGDDDVNNEDGTILDDDDNSDDPAKAKVVCELADAEGNIISSNIMIPVSSTPQQLQQLLRTVMQQARADRQKRRGNGAGDDSGDSDAEEELLDTPHGFFLDDGRQILASLMDSLHAIQREQWLDKQIGSGRRVKPGDGDKLPFVPPAEQTVKITARPEATFRVRPVTRCAATLEGHSDAVLVVAFSPDGECLASGGGDREIRIWDVNTTTPIDTLTGHGHWVQVLAWSPDGRFLASGSRDGGLRVWRHGLQVTSKNADDEEAAEGAASAAAATALAPYTNFKAQVLQGHTNFLSHISWEPMHLWDQNTGGTGTGSAFTPRFVTASKDATLKVWRVGAGLQFPLTGHTLCVTCVKWGGGGHIYSSSQDRSVIVWSGDNGAQLARWGGHAHWINFLALNTDNVLRTGAFDHEMHVWKSPAEAAAHARKRYDAVVQRCQGERVVSCSDDNTLFLWAGHAASDGGQKKSIARMTGHQGLIYHAAFSPDGTMLASCSNDKSVRVWRADNGNFVCVLRGHVAAVYHVSWSLDSRMVVSASRDTTLKLWSVAKRELINDMTGHADEIFATDWIGAKVATGSKDKTVRLFVH